MAKVAFDPYVIGLITGKTKTSRNKDGNLVETFVPNMTNKYLPLPMVLSMNKNLSIQACMEKEGIHPRFLELDRSIYKKTPEERALLKKTILEHNKQLRAVGKNPKKHMNVTSE